MALFKPVMIAAMINPLIVVALTQGLSSAVTPAPRDGWHAQRHAAINAVVQANTSNVDVVFIGDSITQGWEQAGQSVWEHYYSGRKAVNLGISGDRTEHVLWRLDHGNLEGIEPEVAVIMIGTNNTGHRQDPPKETAAGIKKILGELKKRLPKTKVLLLAVFPRGATADDKLRKINTGINKIIKKFAKRKNVSFLDINSTFLDDDGNLSKDVMPDLLQPHEKGYRMWAEAMEPTIKKLIGG